MKTKKTDLCPICNQYMDMIVTSCRNSLFVDDKFYPKMCFGCFHTPADEKFTYYTDGRIKSVEGPFWDHKHLHTAQELVDNDSCDSLAQARKCVNGVRTVIKKAGLTGRKKPKSKKRPKQEHTLNDK